MYDLNHKKKTVGGLLLVAIAVAVFASVSVNQSDNQSEAAVAQNIKYLQEPKYSPHLTAIGAQRAWALADGSGVEVASCESAFIQTSHEDLAPNIGVGSGQTNGDSHATQMAGLIAAADNGVGTIGVAPRATLHNVTGVNTGTIPGYPNLEQFSCVVASIDEGAQIINQSIYAYDPQVYTEFDPRVPDYYDWLIDEWKYADDNDVFVVNSIGNQQKRLTDRFRGRFTTGVVGIHGAAGMHKLNHGPSLDIVVPSSDYGGWLTDHRDGYKIGTYATSGSAAITSGVAALMLDVNPSLSAKDIGKILRQSSLDLGPKGRDDNYGWGRLHAGNAVACAKNYTGSCKRPRGYNLSMVAAKKVKHDVYTGSFKKMELHIKNNSKWTYNQPIEIITSGNYQIDPFMKALTSTNAWTCRYAAKPTPTRDGIQYCRFKGKIKPGQTQKLLFRARTTGDNLGVLSNQVYLVTSNDNTPRNNAVWAGNR